MRVTCGVRAIQPFIVHQHAITRHVPGAIFDVKNTLNAVAHYGPTASFEWPSDAQPFSVSVNQSLPHYVKGVICLPGQPRPIISHQANLFQQAQKRLFGNCIDHNFNTFFYRYMRAEHALRDEEWNVTTGRGVLGDVLDAIMKRDLSLVSDLMLDSSILTKIANASKALTDRQLSCLDVTNDDYVGVDGLVNYWSKNDHPSNIISSLKWDVYEKQPIFTYSLDFFAVYRKNILLAEIADRPLLKQKLYLPAPVAYGLPHARMLHGRVEFAHLTNGSYTSISPEDPAVLNFHVHSL